MARCAAIFVFIVALSTSIAAVSARSVPVSDEYTSSSSSSSVDGFASTPVWPLQFHAVMYQNRSNHLSIIDLWYDYPNQRNLNVINRQLSSTLYDVEWGNGTSYYYDLESRACKKVHFPVGILRPDWLAGATFLCQETVDGFLTNVWSKADFITYYVDVATGRPVRWTFFDGMDIHVIKYEPGAVLPERYWNVPSYCRAPSSNEDVTWPEMGFQGEWTRVREATSSVIVW